MKNFFIIIIFIIQINLSFSQEGTLFKKHRLGLNISNIFQKSPEIHYDYQINEYYSLSGYSGYALKRDAPEYRNSIKNIASGFYLDAGCAITIFQKLPILLFIKFSGTISFLKHFSLVEIQTFYGNVLFPYEESVVLRSLTITDGIVLFKESTIQIDLFYSGHFISYGQFLLLKSDYPIPGMGSLITNASKDNEIMISFQAGIILKYCFNREINKNS